MILPFRDVTLFSAPYKAGAGIGVLELHTATIGALASFLLLQLSYTQIMVGWVGAPKGAPVSVCAGYANPAQFTTSEIGVSGGGSYPLHTEAAIMATVPALTRLNDEDLHKLSYVTTCTTCSAQGNSFGSAGASGSGRNPS